jgi:hypothetical protein
MYIRCEGYEMFSWKALHRHPRYKEKSVLILVPFIIVVSQLNLSCVKEVDADSQIRIFSKIPLLGVPTHTSHLPRKFPQPNNVHMGHFL